MSIGLMPAYSNPARQITKTMSVATAKYGMIAVPDATSNHDGAKINIAAGETLIEGVITSQGDPNNSDLFAVGDQPSVAIEGIVEVLFAAGEVIAKGDTIITGGTAGCGKVLGAEAKPYAVLGYAEQAITIGAAAGRASVRLSIHSVPA